MNFVFQDTGKQVSNRSGKKCARAVDVTAVLPHPGPLPLGEGEPFAASRKTCGGIGGRGIRISSEHRPRLPSPSGRGIEGEGERNEFSVEKIFHKAMSQLDRLEAHSTDGGAR